MRKIKFFFLLTALLAIAQGAEAALEALTFTSNSKTQGVVTVTSGSYDSSNGLVASSSSNINVSVQAGYTISQVEFFICAKINGSGSLSANRGDLNSWYPSVNQWATVSKINNTSVQLSANSPGDYRVNQIRVTYSANSYTIRFNGNGSTDGSMDNQQFTYGTAQNLTANAFSKPGYMFSGWATSNTGDKVYDDEQNVNNLTTTNNETIDLYAVWTFNQAAVDAVEDLIDAICKPVVYTGACYQSILVAREAYDALTDEQKSSVENYSALTAAEAAYAASNVDITANQDPEHTGTYYSTFYDGSRHWQLPESGVEAFVATISGEALNLTRIAGGNDVIPQGTAVILKSTTQEYTLTPIGDAPVLEDDNDLEGVDAETAISAVVEGTCYVLSGANGVGFYLYEAPNQLQAHKAYIDLPAGSPAPRRMRFIFDQENTATSVDNAEATISIEKRIENGQLIIIRNGERYNAQGQIVK